MNEVISLLKNQGSTRRNQFSSRMIKQEDIDIIKASIVKTANASNRQSYSIIELDLDQADSLGLPGNKVLLFCIDFYRLHRCAELLGYDFDSSYIMQFTTALIDISMLAQSSILAANSLGIDTLITNEVYHKKLEKIFDTLNIPSKYVFPMIALCLGYSKIENKVQKGRVELNHLFHQNYYEAPSDKEILKLIEEYDNEEKNIGLIKDWKKQGYEHYLEWFFDKWSPAIGSRKESDALLHELNKHEMI